MRTLRLLVVATALAPAVGCKWLDEMRGDQGRIRPAGKIPEVSPDRLVTFLNERADRLRSVEYDSTRMRVSGKGIPVPATLDGDLAVAQPRNFRLVSTGRVAAAKVIMGSNDEQFWVYLAAPGDPAMYVYASHDDFASGRAKMPGGLPFEPDWVMQALGMTVYPPTNRYEVSINERERTYTLWWLANSPAGQVRKEVVFDADAATGSRPQVKRHVIRDPKGGLIATAEIRSAETVRVGTDPKTGLPLAAQYPTHIVMKWENPRFEMDLSLEKARVNQAGDASQFARPTIRGTEPIDLARYEFPPLK